MDGPPTPAVVWKYDDERAQYPMAGSTQQEMEAMLNAAWARLPLAVKRNLDGVRISLVHTPSEYPYRDPSVVAPDEDGGVTIHDDLWLEQFEDGEQAVGELANVLTTLAESA